LAIRTTFLVGFPGEAERDHEILMRFVEKARFDHLGVFTFSREAGTAAFDFGGQIPKKTKERRRRELMRLQQSISLERNLGRVGERVGILIDTPASRLDVARGRLPTQAPDVDGAVLIPGETVAAGAVTECEIVAAGPYDLVARTVR
jgi:ribosomal protein S12 methylthiotransferase